MKVERPCDALHPHVVVLLIGATIIRSPRPEVKHIGHQQFELILTAMGSTVPIQLLTCSAALRLDLKTHVHEQLRHVKAIVAICVTQEMASLVVHDNPKAKPSQGA